MKHSESAWNEFTNTGKIEDYLSYLRMESREREHQGFFGEANLNEVKNAGNSPQGLQNGR